MAIILQRLENKNMNLESDSRVNRHLTSNTILNKYLKAATDILLLQNASCLVVSLTRSRYSLDEIRLKSQPSSIIILGQGFKKY